MADHDQTESGEFWIEVDEDPEGEAAWLRSVGLDPEAATRDDLLRVLDQMRTSTPVEPCLNDHGPDGMIACWSPGGPCPKGQTVCETCGPCAICRPGEHPILSPGINRGPGGAS